METYKTLSFRMSREEYEKLERLQIHLKERLSLDLPMTSVIKHCISLQANHLLKMPLRQTDLISELLTMKIKGE